MSDVKEKWSTFGRDILKDEELYLITTSAEGAEALCTLLNSQEAKIAKAKTALLGIGSLVKLTPADPKLSSNILSIAKTALAELEETDK